MFVFDGVIYIFLFLLLRTKKCKNALSFLRCSKKSNTVKLKMLLFWCYNRVFGSMYLSLFLYTIFISSFQ